MSVLLESQTIIIAGECGVEEAESLLALLQRNPQASVDVSRAGFVHTALWQVLIALAPRVTGIPPDPVIAKWILPLLADGRKHGAAT